MDSGIGALVMIGGLPMRPAVGTSLLVIALNSFAGLAGYLGHVTIDPTPAAVLTLAAVVGSLAGGALAARVHPGVLRRTFAWFVLAAGVVMLAHQLAPARWHPASPVLLGAVLVLLLAVPLQRCVAHGKKTP